MNGTSGSASRSNRRREMDLMKLMKSARRIVYPSDRVSEFWVEFQGPEGTPYEDGVWVLHVVLPDDYPFKSPSIGFSNRILHPNVDESSGTVCLDVINQTWTPMYELENIFDVFLPQLLRYPNPADPLNPSAAAYLQRDPIGYVTLLQEHIAAHATRDKALSTIPSPYGPQAKTLDGVEEEEINGNGSHANGANGTNGLNGDGSTSAVASGDSAPPATEEEDRSACEDYEPEEIEL